MSLLAPYEDAVGSSVGSDCRLGGGDEWTVSGDKLYFTATIRNASQVFCLEKTGDIRPVYTREGSVDCVALQGGRPVLRGGCRTCSSRKVYRWDGKERRQLTCLNQDALGEKYVARPEKLTFL